MFTKRTPPQAASTHTLSHQVGFSSKTIVMQQEQQNILRRVRTATATPLHTSHTAYVQQLPLLCTHLQDTPTKLQTAQESTHRSIMLQLIMVEAPTHRPYRSQPANPHTATPQWWLREDSHTVAHPPTNPPTHAQHPPNKKARNNGHRNQERIGHQQQQRRMLETEHLDGPHQDIYAVAARVSGRAPQ